MKRVKMIVVALLISASTNAQITLEHTYNVSANNVGLVVVQLANSGAKYVVTEPAQHQVKLYNTNHSLWKTIPIPSISGYTFSNVMHISENLFNLDAQVECVAYYYSTTPVQYYTKIINESGAVIKDLPNRMPGGIATTAPNTF